MQEKSLALLDAAPARTVRPSCPANAKTRIFPCLVVLNELPPLDLKLVSTLVSCVACKKPTRRESLVTRELVVTVKKYFTGERVDQSSTTLSSCIPLCVP